jgi:hypothetical protein
MSKTPVDKLKNNISEALHDHCEEEVVEQIIQTLHQTPVVGNEPGVELIDSLAPMIEGVLQKGKELNCNLSGLIKAIIVGCFRSSPNIRSEAHKTIDHLVRHILESVFKLKLDATECARATIEGIILAAKEEKLNAEEAAWEAATSIILAVHVVDTTLETKMISLFNQPIAGVKINLKQRINEKKP